MPRKAVLIGMYTSLSCQKKRTDVTQARLELATVRLQVVRATFVPAPLHSDVYKSHKFRDEWEHFWQDNEQETTGGGESV